MQRKEYAVCAAGIATVLILWGYAAFALAPSMQDQLQQHSDALLHQVEHPVSATVDGLDVVVTGSVPNPDVRFAVRKALKPLHAVAKIRVQLDFPSRRSGSVDTGNSPVSESQESTNATGAIRSELFVVPDTELPLAPSDCSELADLDPESVCGHSGQPGLQP